MTNVKLVTLFIVRSIGNILKLRNNPKFAVENKL